MAQVSLGIYLDNSTIAAAAVRRTVKQTEILGFESRHLPGSDLAEESILAEAVSFISMFISRQKLKIDLVYFGVNHQDLLWNWVEMPPVSRGELRQLMQYDLELHVPLDPSTVYYDVLPIGSAGVPTPNVLLVTSPQAVINQCVELCSRVNLRPEGVEPGALARYRLLQLALKERVIEVPEIAITFGEDWMELLLLQDGKPAVHRVLTGADPWGRTESNLDGETDAGSDLGTVDQIIREIKLCRFSLGLEGSLDSVNQVAVFGAVPDEWITQFENRCPHCKVTSIKRINSYILEGRSVAEQTALGLAFTGQDEDETLNLLPVDIRPVHRNTGMMLTGALSGLLVSLAILTGMNAFFKTELALARTEFEINRMTSSVNQIVDIRNNYERVKTDYDRFVGLSRNYPSQLEILRELTRLMPTEDTETDTKVWLERYECRENILTIRGSSQAPEALITILENSPYFEKVKFKGNVQGENFTIEAEISMYSDELEEYEDTEMDPASMSPVPDTGEESGDGEDATAGDRAGTRSGAGDRFNGRGQPPAATYDEEPRRGPAFPRSRDSDQAYQPPVDIPPPPPPAQGTSQRDPEEVERMKENLFEFIRQHKESGNVVERDRENYVEPDPEEAAENFLEFLRSAAEQQESGDATGFNE